jgi:hypothetical protein
MSKQVETTKIHSVLKTQLFADLGVNLTSPFSPTHEYRVIVDMDISPAMCGPVGCMFKRISVSVQAGICVKFGTTILYLIYDFNYEHANGGTNGYDVRKEIDCQTGLPFVYPDREIDE